MESRMVSDSITNASIPVPVSNAAKDSAKKKRVNRMAKLKQWKMEARREQWLSQVKNKDINVESSGRRGPNPRSMHARNDSDRSIENLEIKPRDQENDAPIHNHFSDLESPSNSPTSHGSSVLSGNDSGTNFTGSSSSSSTSSCSRGYSGSITDEDEDGGDWETHADAMTATDDKKEQKNPSLDHPSKGQENTIKCDLAPELRKLEFAGQGQKGPSKSRAWRPDDAFRPQSLPNLAKQRSFPMNSDRHYAHTASVWACKNVQSAPSACPICCEDLDLTDTSFDPCSCGFRLCLFCHKRIFEEDGRCPGCRKQYDCDPMVKEASIDGGSLTIRLARSQSMITRKS